MKNLLFSILFLFISWNLSAQTGIGTSDPDPSAVLELKSSDKGLLLPRMTSAQRLAVAAVEGLQVYDTNLNTLMLYADGKWGSFPRTETINSQITAILQYQNTNNITVINNTLASYSILHNPENWLEAGSTPQLVRFKRPGKYDISVYASVERTTGSNSMVSIEFNSTSTSSSVKDFIDLPGGLTAVSSSIGRGLITVVNDEEFKLDYNRLAEATANSNHNLKQLIVIIRVME